MSSANKNVVSQFTSCTTNRGVEAKETEIANVQLDESEAGAPPPAPAQDVASYIHVIVEKHKRGQSGAGDEGLVAEAAGQRGRVGPGAPAGQLGHAGDVAPLYDCSSLLRTAQSRAVQTPDELFPDKNQAQLKNAVEWRREEECSNDRPWMEEGPCSVEVWQFEGGGCLAGAGGGEARLGRWWARAGAARGRRWAAEAGAVPLLVLTLPLCALEAAARAAAGAVRAALAAVLGAAGDGLLKPALALVFNALVRPPLVFAGEALGAARRALAPLCLAAGDAAAPLATLLRQLRLVDVHIHHTHTHTHLPRHSTPADY